jgi:hypothetical protein
MSDINSKLGTGVKASTYGWYAHIGDSGFNAGQLTEVLADVIASKAVFQPAVMPNIPLSQITSEIGNDILTCLEQFTSAGVEVWLRFGHEMNWYTASYTSQS